MQQFADILSNECGGGDSAYSKHPEPMQSARIKEITCHTSAEQHSACHSPYDPARTTVIIDRLFKTTANNESTTRDKILTLLTLQTPPQVSCRYSRVKSVRSSSCHQSTWNIKLPLVHRRQHSLVILPRGARSSCRWSTKYKRWPTAHPPTRLPVAAGQQG